MQYTSWTVCTLKAPFIQKFKSWTVWRIVLTYKKSWTVCTLKAPLMQQVLFAFIVSRFLFSHVSAVLQLCPHVLRYGRVDSETKSLKFHVSRPCKRGEQCYLSYGSYPGSHLVTFYGFLPKGDNPYDVIPLGKVLAFLHFLLDLAQPYYKPQS